VNCSRLPLRIAIHSLSTLATSGRGCLVMMNMAAQEVSLRQDDRWESLLLAQSRHAQCADECRLLGAKRTLTNRRLPISIYEYTDLLQRGVESTIP
jgi:hypothetical protein